VSASQQPSGGKCPVAGFAGDAPRLGAGAQSHFAGGLDDQMTILAGLIAESGSFADGGECAAKFSLLGDRIDCFVGHQKAPRCAMLARTQAARLDRFA
jgi:hypothetical protein